MTLVATYTRYQFLETIRVPMAVVGTVFFPAAITLFFVVPFAGDDPVGSTYAIGNMAVMGIMSACTIGLGVGVAEDREQPWYAFSRTLPAGSVPRFAGRILTSLLMSVLALIPVLLIAAFLTEAGAGPGQIVAGIGGLAIGSVPFMLLGLAVGFAVPAKAAIAVTQMLFLPLAFAGGLFFPPGRGPGFINAIAPYMAPRGVAELVWAATTDFQLRALPTVMLGVWTVVVGGAAILAYRRDEGRRFS